ncbi:hypothetical protein JTY93_23515 [Pseudomonas hygromyciniae]|uniref:Glutaminase n=1 Tax=Pseudomonas hygromyciniae TaxID=2812000 RepID=A0ABX7K4Y4_9PSED|nr:hypothetical protein [Pseudomonas hygromyciniae]QSB42433.1 hypothetical protein JTY93_23515 [Pseudomonas hygromyciniae]
MTADGLVAQVEFCGNFLVAEAFGQLLKNDDFFVGQVSKVPLLLFLVASRYSVNTSFREVQVTIR